MAVLFQESLQVPPTLMAKVFFVHKHPALASVTNNAIMHFLSPHAHSLTVSHFPTTGLNTKINSTDFIAICYNNVGSLLVKAVESNVLTRNIKQANKNPGEVDLSLS